MSIQLHLTPHTIIAASISFKQGFFGILSALPDGKLFIWWGRPLIRRVCAYVMLVMAPTLGDMYRWLPLDSSSSSSSPTLSLANISEVACCYMENVHID